MMAAPSGAPPPVGLSPEVELLLLASSGELGRDRFRNLASEPLDWARLTRLAYRAHATSTLWRRLQQTPNLELGPQTAQLQSLGVLDQFRLYHIKKLLASVVKLLGEHGIEVMLLKGAALLVGGTQRPIERGMSDLDIVVVKGSPELAWQLCREAGWSQLYEQDHHQYKGHHHLPPLSDPLGIGLGLEIHRAILPGGAQPLGIDETAFADRARRVPIGQTTVRIPTLEDLMLHACLHFGWGHAFSGHSWCTFSDAHAIVSDPEFRWEKFVELVRSTHAGTCCYWTLRLARTGTRLPVPQDVLDALPAPGSRWLRRALERHLFAQLYDPATIGLPIRLRHFLWQVAVQPRRNGLGKSRPWRLETPAINRTRAAQESGEDRGTFPRSISTLRYLWSMLIG